MIIPCGIHAEIGYDTDDGGIHSDICSGSAGLTPEWAQTLRNNLEEWLANSNGTGYFVVAPNKYDEANGINPDDLDPALYLYERYKTAPKNVQDAIRALLINKKEAR